MLGPIIGQLLYNALGFEFTFYATSLIIAVPAIMVMFTVPNRLNKSRAERDQEKKDNGEEGAAQKKITFKMLLTNKRAVVSAVSSIFAMVIMLFMDTIYSNYLIDFGISDKNIGYFFALPCLIYSIFAPIVGWLCNYI